MEARLRHEFPSFLSVCLGLPGWWFWESKGVRSFPEKGVSVLEKPQNLGPHHSVLKLLLHFYTIRGCEPKTWNELILRFRIERDAVHLCNRRHLDVRERGGREAGEREGGRDNEKGGGRGRVPWPLHSSKFSCSGKWSGKQVLIHNFPSLLGIYVFFSPCGLFLWNVSSNIGWVRVTSSHTIWTLHVRANKFC